MNWIAVFSQSGQEIADLAKKLGRDPDLILTNNLKSETYSADMAMLMRRTPTLMAKHDRLMEFLRLQVDVIGEPDIITLHGYLRIIPGDICEMYNIFNGHPGLINKFPDLKGKDPQEKVIGFPALYSYNGTLKLGSVVHKCTAELDGGTILAHSSKEIDNWEELLDLRGVVYNSLRQTSLHAWSVFLNGALKDENRNLWSAISR